MAEETRPASRRKKAAAQSAEPQTVRIELTRYKSLLDALGDPRKVFRVIATIFSVGVLLFAGIALVIVSVKSIYPYNDITTNALGATTIKNEKGEVSYWLLNTAEPWANSGIRVKKGQTITVRASGKKHTAIHYLLNEARDNFASLSRDWVGSEGFAPETEINNDRDQARARYRIFPDRNQDALLMQIVRDGGEVEDRPEHINEEGRKAYSPNTFIHVGKQLEKYYVTENGTLYFAINDIILDDETVVKMLLNASGDKNPTDWAVAEKKEACKALRKEHPADYAKFMKEFPGLEQTDGKFGEDLQLGLNPSKQVELYGYFMAENRYPWYDDNVGSLLIVVESVNE